MTDRSHRLPHQRSRPVQWYTLITEAEGLTQRTGWGLANVWGAVHREDYGEARSLLDDLLSAAISSRPGQGE